LTVSREKAKISQDFFKEMRMAKGFGLEINPWVYLAKYNEENRWQESYVEKEHLTPEEEERLNPLERAELMAKRNSFPELPLVNYTTQYGLGCFEGLKGFPQKDGSIRIFRPDENGLRMARSMEGLLMPPYPKELFVQAVREVVKRNKSLGFTPAYDPAWEKDNFLSAYSVYIRPFSFTEPGIGVNFSENPWVIIITTRVGSYFKPGTFKAVTTERIRATTGGTGWIKSASNYVISALARKEAERNGYMETVFLDARERKYIQEGSSCNLFFVLKDNTLVTPALQDTILPGITRKSILQIARDEGLKAEERPISIEEVFSEAKEFFACGTAAGVSFMSSITHQGKEKVFGDGSMGEFTALALKTLKGIQYGATEDRHNWMLDVG